MKLKLTGGIDLVALIYGLWCLGVPAQL